MPATEVVPVGMLGADYAIENGRFRIARILTGENWNPDLRAPLSAPGIDVSEGDYILAVNGTPVDATNIYKYFAGTGKKQTAPRVRAEGAGGAVSELRGIKAGTEGLARQRIERMLVEVDMGPRDELDAVKAMAAKARSEQEKLEKRILELEARLGVKAPPRPQSRTGKAKPAAKKAKAAAKSKSRPARKAAPKRKSPPRPPGR